MRWVGCLSALLLIATVTGAAEAQRVRPPPPVRPLPPPVRVEPIRPIEPIRPLPAPPRVEPVRPVEAPPAARCVGHYEIGARSCTALEEAVQGLAWEIAQDRLEDWANAPEESPDPQCVRSARYWVGC